MKTINVNITQNIINTYKLNVISGQDAIFLIQPNHSTPKKLMNINICVLKATPIDGDLYLLLFLFSLFFLWLI